MGAYAEPVDRPWGPLEVARTLEREGAPRVTRLRRDRPDRWVEIYEELAIVVPGGRDCTAEEFLDGDVEPFERHGRWIRVPRRRTDIDAAVRQWCIRNGGELLSGNYAMRAATWRQAKDETLPRPFLPEFDHANPRLRRAAAHEWRRRLADAQLRRASKERDAAVRCASRRLSRREVAKAVGLSFGRIQQITNDTPT